MSTLAAKSIGKCSEISDVIIADFISVFMIEFVNMKPIAVTVCLVTRVVC